MNHATFLSLAAQVAAIAASKGNASHPLLTNPHSRKAVNARRQAKADAEIASGRRKKKGKR